MDHLQQREKQRKEQEQKRKMQEEKKQKQAERMERLEKEIAAQEARDRLVTQDEEEALENVSDDTTKKQKLNE